MKQIVLHAAGAVAVTFVVAACVPAPAPTPTPSPVANARPAPPPAPPPPSVSSNWMDAPRSEGDWSYARAPGGSMARFGSGASEPRFAIACDTSARQVTLTRFGAAAGTSSMTIRTESVSRTVTADAASQTSTAVARVAANDPLLDAMALTKGRFAVEAPGLPALYLPAWGEVTRVIEDCR